jgi:hypothetical protein
VALGRDCTGPHRLADERVDRTHTEDPGGDRQHGERCERESEPTADQQPGGDEEETGDDRNCMSE